MEGHTSCIALLDADYETWYENVKNRVVILCSGLDMEVRVCMCVCERERERDAEYTQANVFE